MNQPPILLDSNVLVYAANTAAPQHLICLRVMSAAIAGEFDGVLVPQVLLETFATLTGKNVQKPVATAEVSDYLDALIERLPVLPVSLDSVMKLMVLARSADARGQAIYDLFLAAQMESHGIERICTYDKRFTGLGVVAVSPDQLLSGG